MWFFDFFPFHLNVMAFAQFLSAFPALVWTSPTGALVVFLHASKLVQASKHLVVARHIEVFFFFQCPFVLLTRKWNLKQKKSNIG